MGRIHTLKIILQIGVIKTTYFNLKYFGFKGLKFPILVARNFKLKKTRGTVILGKNLKGKIFLGRKETHFLEGRGVWYNEGEVIFQGKCIIGNGVKICVGNEGKLKLGFGIYMTGNSLIYCNKNISIGAGTIIGWNTTIMDADQHNIFNNKKEAINKSKEISISPHVWIGINCIILKGSSIPYGSIVAAGSVLSKKFYEERILIGETNKTLKKDVNWEA